MAGDARDDGAERREVGIVALADQHAGRHLGLLNPSLYTLAAHHAAGIVDITHGTTTVEFSRDGKVELIPDLPVIPYPESK